MINENLTFTCRDLLLIPHLQHAVVLAGHKGMDRAINRVNVMEVPDVIDWVRSGEFLVTSGFPFRDRPEQIADMIPQLAERGVAALGIKTKRYIDRIPERVLGMAEQFDFPIIELPLSTSFSDVVREVMERVLVQEARQLSLLQNRFQKMSEQLLYGGGIDDFLRELDEMLHNPVVLLDGANELYFSPRAAGLFPWRSDSPEWARLCQEIQLGVNYMTVGSRKIRVYISAADSRSDACSLLLLEWNQELSMADRLTLDRVGVLVSLEMANLHARREVEYKYVDQFLSDWLTGRIVAVQDLMSRAEACGCKIADGQSYSAIAVRWLDRTVDVRQLQKAAKQFRRTVPEREGLYVTLLDRQLVFLAAREKGAKLQGQLDRIVRELEAGFHTELKSELSLCVGDSVERPEEVYRSCDQARKIHYISSVCGIRDPQIRYKQLGVYQLLYLLPESEEIKEFMDRIVEPLIEYDRKHHTLLVKTLKCYFRNNENARLTAEAMFAHYNTIMYRLERAYELLELSADNSKDRLQLHIGMMLHEMRNRDAADDGGHPQASL